jgi:hydrogenase maturation protease
VKNILILCIGYPYTCDKGFGYHVSKVLEAMQLPENVECLEVGESASEFDYLIDGRDKIIVVDAFRTEDQPGTIVRLKPDEVPLTVDGVTDLGKYHILDTLEQISVSGKCPEALFVGVVPKDTETDTPRPQLTPEIEAKIPELVDVILEEIHKGGR